MTKSAAVFVLLLAAAGASRAAAQAPAARQTPAAGLALALATAGRRAWPPRARGAGVVLSDCYSLIDVIWLLTTCHRPSRFAKKSTPFDFSLNG